MGRAVAGVAEMICDYPEGWRGKHYRSLAVAPALGQVTSAGSQAAGAPWSNSTAGKWKSLKGSIWWNWLKLYWGRDEGRGEATTVATLLLRETEEASVLMRIQWLRKARQPGVSSNGYQWSWASFRIGARSKRGSGMMSLMSHWWRLEDEITKSDKSSHGSWSWWGSSVGKTFVTQGWWPKSCPWNLCKVGRELIPQSCSLPSICCRSACALLFTTTAAAMLDKGEETKAKEGSADGSFPIQSTHSKPLSTLDPTDAAGSRPQDLLMRAYCWVSLDQHSQRQLD